MGRRDAPSLLLSASLGAQSFLPALVQQQEGSLRGLSCWCLGGLPPCMVAPAFWMFLSFRFWISQIEMVREASSPCQPSDRGYSASGLLMPPWAVCTSLGCPSSFLVLCLHAHLTLIAVCPCVSVIFPMREGVVASACQGQNLKARRSDDWLHVWVKGWREGD